MKLRKRQNKHSLNEQSTEPLPRLTYPKRKNQIHEIYIPEYHYVAGTEHKLHVKQYYVKAMYGGDPEPEYCTLSLAFRKFHAFNGKPSYKNWLIALGDEHINDHLLSAINEARYVQIEPEYEIGSIAMLIDTDLPLLLRFVLISKYNETLQCEFDEIDEHLTYFVNHLDLREDKLKKFTKKSGKEFDLVRPKGFVSKASIFIVTSSKYVGNKEISWMEAQNTYFRLALEEASIQTQAVTQLFTATVMVFLGMIQKTIRGTLYRRNEGKIKSVTLPLAKAVMDSALDPKFRKIKKLKPSESFRKRGISTHYIFNTEHANKIFGEYHINRDFDLNGLELFAEDQKMDDNEDNDDDPPDMFTMSTAWISLRHGADKAIVKWNVARVDQSGFMSGHSTTIWHKNASKFDWKDFGLRKRDCKCKHCTST